MIAAVESYLAVRRAAGFTLSNAEYLLRSFATFATNQDQTPIRTATAIDWASQAESVAQRHTRYQTVCHLAQYLRVEDSRHESLPENHFGPYRKTRRVPYIYSRDEIGSLVLAATRLMSADSLQPKTYVALISLLAATGLRISEALWSKKKCRPCSTLPTHPHGKESGIGPCCIWRCAQGSEFRN